MRDLSEPPRWPESRGAEGPGPWLLRDVRQPHPILVAPIGRRQGLCGFEGPGLARCRFRKPAAPRGIPGPANSVQALQSRASPGRAFKASSTPRRIFTIIGCKAMTAGSPLRLHPSPPETQNGVPTHQPPASLARPIHITESSLILFSIRAFVSPSFSEEMASSSPDLMAIFRDSVNEILPCLAVVRMLPEKSLTPHRLRLPARIPQGLKQGFRRGLRGARSNDFRVGPRIAQWFPQPASVAGTTGLSLGQRRSRGSSARLGPQPD